MPGALCYYAAMNLSEAAVAALDHRRITCGETYDPADVETDWALAVSRACADVLRARTVVALAQCKLAQAELDDFLDGDMPVSERREIRRDLCRAGWYRRVDPGAVCTRRIRTITVDGARYEVGP